MSAFVVTENHINYLVQAIETYKTSAIDGDKLATMLLDENRESVAYRYRESLDRDTFIKYKRNLYKPIDPVQVIKACHCYIYQSCEHPGWEESEAKHIIDDLIGTACRHLPGYDDADWEIA